MNRPIYATPLETAYDALTAIVSMRCDEPHADSLEPCRECEALLLEAQQIAGVALARMSR